MLMISILWDFYGLGGDYNFLTTTPIAKPNPNTINIIPKNPAATNININPHALFDPAIPNIVKRDRMISNARNNNPILLQVLKQS